MNKIEEAIGFIEEYKNSCYEGDFKYSQFDNVLEILQRGQRLEEGLIQFLEKENPYSEDVFLPIPKEDFDKINDLLKKEMGYWIDRLTGNIGRRLYESITEILREMIK